MQVRVVSLTLFEKVKIELFISERIIHLSPKILGEYVVSFLLMCCSWSNMNAPHDDPTVVSELMVFLTMWLLGNVSSCSTRNSYTSVCGWENFSLTFEREIVVCKCYHLKVLDEYVKSLSLVYSSWFNVDVLHDNSTYYSFSRIQSNFHRLLQKFHGQYLYLVKTKQKIKIIFNFWKFRN